jgi:hypothetical protein
VALAVVLLTRPHPATPAGASSAWVLLRDDLSSPVNGWQVVTGGSGGYGNGAYHIWLPPTNGVAIAVPARSIKNPRQEDLYGINSSLSSAKPTGAEFDNVVVRTAAAG